MDLVMDIYNNVERYILAFLAITVPTMAVITFGVMIRDLVTRSK